MNGNAPTARFESRMQPRAYWFSSSIFHGLFLAFLLSTITLIFRIPLNGALAPATVILVIAGLFISRGMTGLSAKDTALIAVWLVITLVASVLISSGFFDISYDGQGYHLEAIIQLSQGWNPFYETTASDILPMKDIVAQVNYFPRFSWFVSTPIYQLTDSIETGKAISIILAVATFLLVRSVLQRVFGLGNGIAILISLVVILNPVVSGQLLTFYVDGLVYLLLTALLSSSLLIYHEPEEYSHILLSFIIFVILVNTKFTAAVYATIFVLPVCIRALRAGWPGAKKARRLLPFAALLLSLSVLVSFNPYVTNFLGFGHIFHPVMGDHRESNITDTVAVSGTRDFENRNRWSRFYRSMYSKTYNSMNGVSERKIPLQISRDEYHWIKGSDPRIGGFGPWFSGAFTLSLLSLLLLLRKSDRPERTRMLLVALLVLISSILVHPAFWWARYVPQLYLIPVLVAVFLMTSGRRVQRIASWSIMVMLTGNALFSLVANIDYNVVHTRKIERQLAELRENNSHPHIFFGGFRSYRVRLAEAGVAYTWFIDEDLARCDSKVYLAGSRAYICSTK